MRKIMVLFVLLSCSKSDEVKKPFTLKIDKSKIGGGIEVIEDDGPCIFTELQIKAIIDQYKQEIEKRNNNIKVLEKEVAELKKRKST